jgi:hypothetical protein
MTGDAHQKVNAGHLKRNAYLYVRQSTLRQVFENTESTKRQYGLRQHAVALGWPVERIIVIDSDLGQSGRNCPTAGRCIFCTIRVIQAHSFSAVVGRATTRMEAPRTPNCHASSGCYLRMLTLATSPGNNMRRTSGGSRKTPTQTEPIVARVRRAKVQHCCKAW